MDQNPTTPTPGDDSEQTAADDPTTTQEEAPPTQEASAPSDQDAPASEPAVQTPQDDDEQMVVMQDPGGTLTSTGEPIVENEYEDDASFEEALESTLKSLDEGDIVEGVIVKVDPDEALLDIGYKSEGVIPARELSIKQDVDPREVVQIGDVIEALVVKKEDEEGRLVLSKKRAQYERAWGTIERIFTEDKTVKGTVIEVVKGGLILDIGLRGFLPASLVEMRRVRDLNPYVGTELECKIIELDKNRNNVVLSRRKFLEETQSEFRQEFLSSLQKGEIRKGVVSSIVNFGAFVDLGGVDGLVHVSELAWQHIDHPSEIVDVGDEVTIEVLDVDLERERVSLSLKATQEDPWTKFARENQVGDVIDGEVTKLVPFGAFVQVAEGIEGLVHISELAEHHVEAPEAVVNVGDKIQVKVIDIDTVRRRISLSLKQVAGPAGATGPEASGRPTDGQLTPEQMALAETAYVSSGPRAGAEGKQEEPEGGSSALGDQLRQAGFQTTEEQAATVPEEAGEPEEAPAEETAADEPEAAAEEPAAEEAEEVEAASEEAPAAEESEEAEEVEAASEEAPAAEEVEEPEAASDETPEDAETAEAEEAPEESAEADETPDVEAGEAPDAEAGEPALEGDLAGQADASEAEGETETTGDVSGADIEDVDAEVPETADEEHPTDGSAEAPAKAIAQADEDTETETTDEQPDLPEEEEAGSQA